MASLAQQTAARSDTDILQRLIAAAEIAGIDNAQGWTEANRGRLVAADVGGSTIADVHAYAVTQVHVPLPPGADPQYVTDDQIKTAVAQVQASS